MRPDQEKDEFTVLVGQRLKDCLIAAKIDNSSISQATIRRALDTNKSTVNDWFAGVTLPKGKHIVELAKFFGCTTDWLLSGIGDEREHEYYLLTLKSTKDESVYMIACQCSPVTYCLRQMEMKKPVVVLNSERINSQEYLAYQK